MKNVLVKAKFIEDTLCLDQIYGYEAGTIVRRRDKREGMRFKIGVRKRMLR